MVPGGLPPTILADLRILSRLVRRTRAMHCPSRRVSRGQWESSLPLSSYKDLKLSTHTALSSFVKWPRRSSAQL
jgi:hypothetical protein